MLRSLKQGYEEYKSQIEAIEADDKYKEITRNLSEVETALLVKLEVKEKIKELKEKRAELTKLAGETLNNGNDAKHNENALKETEKALTEKLFELDNLKKFESDRTKFLVLKNQRIKYIIKNNDFIKSITNKKAALETQITQIEEQLSGKSIPAETQELSVEQECEKKLLLRQTKTLENLKTKNADLLNLEQLARHIPNPDNLIEVKGLQKNFVLSTNFFGKPELVLKAVNNVSLGIKRGTTMGIVGESGCGKTTMGRTILKLHDISAGRVYFQNQDITKLKGKALRILRPKMSIIFQDPYSSMPPRMTIGEIIGEGVKVHKIVPKHEVHDYVLDIMKKCGVDPTFFSRYPHEFSGGQRQRICIARALALKPDFVVCDEPVSALDVSIQAQIINLLKSLQREMNLTYLFISHDLSVVQHIADEICIMYLGNIVERGDKKIIFDNPAHPYTKALFSAVPVPDPNVKMNRIVLSGDIPSPAHPPEGCKFHTRCSECKDICKSVAPVEKELQSGHSVCCHLYD